MNGTSSRQLEEPGEDRLLDPENRQPAAQQGASVLGPAISAMGAGLIQRKVARRRLQRKEVDGAPLVQRRADADSGLPESQVQDAAARGVSGAGGEVPYRGQMESAFGTSFSDVKVHTGGAAVQASKSIGAEAYTMGSSIAFADASPAPSLVAHELAHVVQQRAGAGPPSGVGQVGDSFEREADSAASAVASGGSTDLAARYSGGHGAGSAPVQRRVPLLDDVGANLQGPNGVHLANKVKKSIRVEWDRLSPPEQLTIEQKIHAKHNTDVDTLLTLGTPVDANKQLALEYLVHRFEKLGGNKVHPGDVANRLPAGPEVGNLNSLQGAAVTVMDNLAASVGGSNEYTQLTRVFGATYETKAQAMLTSASAALTRLHNANSILVDAREEAAPLHIGGSSSPSGMCFPAAKYAAVNNASKATFVHEATHAASPNTGDSSYRGMGGFDTAEPNTKLKNASHYEEAAAAILGGHNAQLCTPGVANVPPPIVGNHPYPKPKTVDKAKSRARTQIIRAWVRAFNLNNWLNEYSRNPHSVATHNKNVKHWSELMGLSIHKRMEKKTATPIYKLDLALVETRVGLLGDRIGTVNALNAGFDGWWQANYVALTLNKIRKNEKKISLAILRQALTNAGPIWGTTDKDLLMVNNLFKDDWKAGANHEKGTGALFEEDAEGDDTEEGTEGPSQEHGKTGGP